MPTPDDLRSQAAEARKVAQIVSMTSIKLLLWEFADDLGAEADEIERHDALALGSSVDAPGEARGYLAI